MEAMGPQYYLFICTNTRPAGHPRGSCGPHGAQECMMRVADEIGKRNLWDKVMLAGTSCLGPCGQGVTIAIYPEGTWYWGVKPEDVPEVIEAMTKGERVSRLLYAWPKPEEAPPSPR